MENLKIEKSEEQKQQEFERYEMLRKYHADQRRLGARR